MAESSGPMSAEEFAQRMRDIPQKDGDTEYEHGVADALLCELLGSLGYCEGVNAYDAIPKWYA